ncbi:MAG: aconitate hydratase AcnA [Spirochaetota bacterium]|jgi:aconitate hydratase|nr:aconitate hydratase AcnA [Spirochaetota bacterium]
MHDIFGTYTLLKRRDDEPQYAYHDLKKYAAGVDARFEEMPYSARVLLEMLLRNGDDAQVCEAAARWANSGEALEFPFLPARVLLQDFTGVPALADLAAMRDAVAELGGDPARVNPLIPVDLVIDHSLQVDHSGNAEAFDANLKLEYERNSERYRFLRWGQQAFQNFRVIPPASGIIHQVNLEYLATLVCRAPANENGEILLYPDSLVGTDSHTTMINGLGVLGWGVGGIEAEAVMLGQPIPTVVSGIVGVRLFGAKREGISATDIALTLTEALRKHRVVGKFVEFFGPSLGSLSLADRATLANMAPEYGATTGFFPADAETLAYLRLTGRASRDIDLAERYLRAAGLFREEGAPEPHFSSVLDFDLSRIEPSVAGPKRPQDRIPLAALAENFRQSLTRPTAGQGFGVPASTVDTKITLADKSGVIGHGSVILASITSCTNTSNPAVLLAAGLLAKKAAARGMTVPKYVKTSFAPGSRAVQAYLERAGLLAPLAALGFHTVGYGCATCIGNSGPLAPAVVDAVREGALVAAAVLSGNRNFEGRISPQARANYLASPPLVVAFALAGRADIDFASEPLGKDSEGKPVYLADIWPSDAEIAEAAQAVTPEIFAESYRYLFQGEAAWAMIPDSGGLRFNWDASSGYIRRPPFFENTLLPVTRARVLAILGDSITTDHISPAGSIAPESPAARYLEGMGVARADFNSYGSRRGNHEVMMRGTFANIRLRNLLLPGSEGGVTKFFSSQGAAEELPIYEAAMRYRETGTPLVILAGRDYGMGSSRDWAAKGTLLLGVRVVIAVSYERIHRSNLAGMGVLPLEFVRGEDAMRLGLDGSEVFSFEGAGISLRPGSRVQVTALRASGEVRNFETIARIDSAIEAEYMREGGILPMMARRLARAQ